ncbi:dTDP-4-dehydrorhamnose reductase [Sphingomonas bacterium]|uniref:dTDP-4-dehydrorhamnose reductase n=1 Tax=Sphingomonas bacterium TaxID=1895847 RepID=UPI0015771739|nr:dTDP-4-dehydrorhamnose reductase [Sphingomonas bacterium]
MNAILVTGGSGQIGRSLKRLAPEGFELVMPTRSELDISDPESCAEFVAARDWAAVISSGAYTAVDKAEADVTAAWEANAIGPAALAAATAKAGIPILHVSTDYVFDGSRPGFYRESDPVAPIGVYGASKEGGEQAVRTANPRHIILRTAWVVSPFGNNFVKTMLRLGAERPQLRVVGDQYGCPTSALDIASTLLALLDHATRDAAPPWGTYQFVNAGEASWHALACAVLDRAATHGRPRPEIEAIATSDYPTPARRPANSRLSTAKLEQAFGIAPRAWQAAIDDIVDELVGAQA